jgi:hypothetical protein
MARYRSAPKCLEIDDLDQLSIPELWPTDKAAGRRRLDAALAKARSAAPAPARASSAERRYVHSVGGTVVSFDPSPAA